MDRVLTCQGRLQRDSACMQACLHCSIAFHLPKTCLPLAIMPSKLPMLQQTARVPPFFLSAQAYRGISPPWGWIDPRKSGAKETAGWLGHGQDLLNGCDYSAKGPFSVNQGFWRQEPFSRGLRFLRETRTHERCKRAHEGPRNVAHMGLLSCPDGRGS